MCPQFIQARQGTKSIARPTAPSLMGPHSKYTRIVCPTTKFFFSHGIRICVCIFPKECFLGSLRCSGPPWRMPRTAAMPVPLPCILAPYSYICILQSALPGFIPTTVYSNTHNPITSLPIIHARSCDHHALAKYQSGSLFLGLQIFLQPLHWRAVVS